MEIGIRNRGRGPEIIGTRITVYTIMDYLKSGCHPDLIAAELRLGSDQVRAAIRYIEEHKEEVTAAYQRMLDRSANYRNPPEVEALREVGRAKLQELLRNRPRSQNQETANGEHPGGQ